MSTRMFLSVYADVCDEIRLAAGGTKWAAAAPDAGSEACRDWDDYGGGPNLWSLSALEGADRHGLRLLGAAVDTFSDVASRARGANNFLACMSALRVVVETSALAAWVLAPGQRREERLTRYGNLVLEDICHRRKFLVGVSKATRTLADPELKANEVLKLQVIEALRAVRGDDAMEDDKTGQIYFGKKGSPTERIKSLLRTSSASNTQAQHHVDALYSFLSAPSHASVTSIQMLYELRVEGPRVVSEPAPIPSFLVGNSLLLTATSLMLAMLAANARCGLPLSQELVEATRRLADLVVNEDLKQ